MKQAEVGVGRTQSHGHCHEGVFLLAMDGGQVAAVLDAGLVAAFPGGRGQVKVAHVVLRPPNVVVGAGGAICARQ